MHSGRIYGATRTQARLRLQLVSSFVAGLAVFLFLATFDRSQHRILPLCHVASNSVLIGSEADTRQQGDATLGTEIDALQNKDVDTDAKIDTVKSDLEIDAAAFEARLDAMDVTVDSVSTSLTAKIDDDMSALQSSLNVKIEEVKTTVRSNILVRLRNLVIFEVFQVNFGPK